LNRFRCHGQENAKRFGKSVGLVEDVYGVAVSIQIQKPRLIKNRITLAVAGHPPQPECSLKWHSRHNTITLAGLYEMWWRSRLVFEPQYLQEECRFMTIRRLSVRRRLFFVFCSRFISARRLLVIGGRLFQPYAPDRDIREVHGAAGSGGVSSSQPRRRGGKRPLISDFP